ncbi:MAG: glycerol-3-phosphate dehydrogenase/oxidase, partial [Dehalococcoidia bacterium]
MDSRRARLREAADRRYDVIVIGGGINGAGIARDAAERGLAVLLLDQEDWGFGTTWRSTKLIHGGLRYLEHGELGLVFESLRERGVLLRTAPHLVRPLPFLLPVYRNGRRGMATLRLGLTLYDLLAVGGGLPRHRAMSVSATAAAEPRLDRSGLRGGLAYWDGQVELPERLCLENVLRAREAGATALSYVRVERLEVAGGRVGGVSATDTRGGESYEMQASLVVNAAGPWVDRVLRPAVTRQRLIAGTRGTHLVVQFPDGGPRQAIYAEADRDGRPFFIIPWRGVHLIGTTDVPVEDPEATLPSDDEVDYLIEAARTILPGECLERADVWYAYAGIRPLPAGDRRNAGAIPRRHYIVDH